MFIKECFDGVDVSLGGLLAITGVILEVTTFGGSSIVSCVMGAIGIGIVTTLSVSSKISDKLANKNRNFEVLSAM